MSSNNIIHQIINDICNKIYREKGRSPRKIFLPFKPFGEYQQYLIFLGARIRDSNIITVYGSYGRVEIHPTFNNNLEIYW